MKYIAAYMLVKLNKENPKVEDIKRIIESVGNEFEERKAEEIINKLEGRNINEVIEEGQTKLRNISNDGTTRNEQQTSNEQIGDKDKDKDKDKEEVNEEEEALELGDVFDDLFN